MKTLAEIKALVERRIRGSGCDFPVVVQVSPEDSTTFWVQVFAVPPERVREIKNIILGLQDELTAADEVLLLPMVKNLAVTQQHYPKHMPHDAAALPIILGRLFDDWQAIRYVDLSDIIGTKIDIAMGVFGPVYILQEPIGGDFLASRLANGNLVAANNEMALAA
ncbi:MAG: hypothetical protein NTV49_05880 [Kiritimatiellaeota bacterium]|nr:hypothetical protein [Kiritimatiellota bacterium]